jgi:hypothetical protein
MRFRLHWSVCVAALLAAACSRGSRAPSTSTAADSARIRADVTYLASDVLEGRGTGTPGNDSAAAYIARRYAALGLRALSPGYLQPFEARSAVLAHSGGAEALRTQNVAALLVGSDPTLRGEVIVVGAHFDHLGRSAVGALDPEAGDAIRNGADDNASGTAAVLELARLFALHPPRRSLLFANFSGEELGLLGSQYFVDHAPVALDSVVAMLNFDMVGRLRGDSIIVYGVATARQFPALLDSANAPLRLAVRGLGDGFGPSDHSSFFARGIPVLHFFTNLHDDYHRASDDVARLNAMGEARVVTLAERFIRALDASDSRPTFVRGMAPPAVAGARSNTGVYLGSIPDMSAGDVVGLKLTGVRAGSPADSAGLKPGDVVVEFGGARVTDLQTYSDALYSHKPGDDVDIVVLRNGQRVTVKVKLGKRG